MTAPSHLLQAAIFDVFADLIESEFDLQESVKRGKLIGDGYSEKILGITAAQSYFAHGVWRFGGAPAQFEPDILVLLRGIAQDLAANSGQVDAVIAARLAQYPPAQAAPGTEVSVGLLYPDSEYSGDLVLVYLRDLAAAVIQEDGMLSIKSEGLYEQTLAFTYQKKTPGALIEERLNTLTLAAAKPKGP